MDLVLRGTVRERQERASGKAGDGRKRKGREKKGKEGGGPRVYL